MTDAPLWTIAPFLVLVFIASLTGALFRPGQWYDQLAKPPWTPPNWLFPVVWGLLYVLMAYAAWRVWDTAGIGPALGLWGVQLVLNAGWSAVFFGLRRPALALVEVTGLWLAVAATLVAFLQIDLIAGAVMAPYLTWVTIASVLNAEIVRLRRSTP